MPKICHPCSTKLFVLLVACYPGFAAGLFEGLPTPDQVTNVKLFEEPLVPVGTPSIDQAHDLAPVLEQFAAKGSLEALEPIAVFLKAHPDSPWKLALLVNEGLLAKHVGRTSQALEAWEAAWSQGKTLKEPVGKALADRALGELLGAYAGLGRQDALAAMVKEVEARPLAGLVTEKLSGARESLAYMQLSPVTAFRCGPVALSFLKATRDPLAFSDLAVRKMFSTPQGTSLAMNADWASQVNLSLQMARRAPGAGLPLPCVIHFRTGHFAAAMAERGGKYLVQDPFLGDAWMSRATLDLETSGYALVPAGSLPEGWSPVTEAEGKEVWGKGAWGPGRPDDTRPGSVKVPSALAYAPSQVPRPAYHADLVSLNLDFPVVTYTPVKGPRVDFTVTYNQREYGQPQVFDYCNLGPKWTFSFLACIKDDTTSPFADVTVCNPGGGGLIFHARADGTYLPENDTQAVLCRQGNGYVIAYPDGRKECYELADRAWGLRRIVLTRIQGVFGLEAKLTWDPMLRLKAVTDAAGLSTTVAYEGQDPLKISKITDPFGQATRFDYSTDGRLVTITAPKGHVTKLTYPAGTEMTLFPQDFVQSLESPEGRTTFREGEGLVGPSYRRWIEANGPAHDSERLETGTGYAYEIPPEKLPAVPELDPGYHPLIFRFRETFSWAPGAYEAVKPDFKKAMHIRWGHGPGGFSSGLVLSEKAPEGPRHWYVHTGDFWDGIFQGARSASFPLTPDGGLKPGMKLVGVRGTDADKDRLAPVFDGNRALVTRDYWTDKDGGTQVIRKDFDSKGRLVGVEGPSGKAQFTWAPTTGELLGVGIPKTSVEHRFQYDESHRLVHWSRPETEPLVFTYDRSGRLVEWKAGQHTPWTLGYDARGRLQTAGKKGRKARKWVFAWDATDCLQTVTDPKGNQKNIQTLFEDPPPGYGSSGDPSLSPSVTLGIGRPLEVPGGCEGAFAGVLEGINGPLIQRLINLH